MKYNANTKLLCILDNSIVKVYPNYNRMMYDLVNKYNICTPLPADWIEDSANFKKPDEIEILLYE